MAISRYRLLEFYPRKLRFRNGTVVLSFGADAHSWVFYAQKEADPAQRLEIFRRGSMFELGQAQYAGFDVEAASPADKIMKALVAQDGAVAMKPGETYFAKRERSRRYH